MKNAIVALKLLFVLTFVTGIIYPLAIMALGKAFFPNETAGSLVIRGDKVLGSRLIGQKFSSERYFWGRPSAIDYNPLPSGGSNLGPTAKKLQGFANEQRTKFPGDQNPPQELIFASASGLDPDITPWGARAQIERILKARGWMEGKREGMLHLVNQHTIGKQFGFLGVERVNVLALNLALDELK